MTAAGGWLLVPLVLAVVLAGWGLLVDALCGRPLPAALLPGVGLAGLICACGLVVLIDGAGPAIVPLALFGTAAGLVLGRDRLVGADHGAWVVPLGAAAGVLLVQALPTLVDGGVIGGFGRLDDSATWLGLTDRLVDHGRGVEDLPPGTYTRVLQDYLAQGYPVGALLPLGVASQLSLQDVANGYQPVIAMYAVVLACSLYAVARTLVTSRAAAGLVALVAAQASLLYGYAQWGGIKELAAAALLATFGASIVRCWGPDRAPAVAVVLIVAGALCGVLGVDAAPWVLPGAVLALGGWAWRARKLALRPALMLAPLAVIVALPALSGAKRLILTTPTPFTDFSAVPEQELLGRLLEPLNLLQGAGLWPQEDFRAPAASELISSALAMVVVLLALGALELARRRRAYDLLALLVVVGTGSTAALIYGTPWIDGKALAITSPFVLGAAATLLAHMVADRGGRVAAGGALVLVCAVTVSTTAVVRSTPSAPRPELAELRDIGDEYAGVGPTLFLAHQVYATRHFLRRMDIEGASERRDRFVRLTDGSLAPDYTEVDVSTIAAADLSVYRLVVRRTGAPGVMPSGYAKLFDGDHWEVWRREGRLGTAP